MGNVADKGRCQGYYGATGEHISYENADDFLVVTLSPACTGNPPEEARAIKSPFEVPAVTLTTTDVRRTGLEGSVDSGYAEVHAAAGKTTSRETHPEPIPSKPLENTDPVVTGLSNPDCRTAKSLGNCHAFFGFRAYHYNDMECEGNKHILDNDL